MYSIISIKYDVVLVLMTRVVVHGKSVGSPLRPPHMAIPRRWWRKFKLKVCSRTRARGRTTDHRHRKRDILRLKRCHLQHYGGELGSSTNNNVIIIRGRARPCLDSLVAVSLRRENYDNVGHALRSSWTRYLALETRILERKTRNLRLETRYSMISNSHIYCIVQNANIIIYIT